MTTSTRTLVGVLLLALATPLAGQQERPLTRAAAEAVAEFYNRAGTSRVTGPTEVAAGNRVDGDLAALGGPVTVAGTVRGDLLVINGDVRLEPGARVTGDLTVVGGTVRGPTEAVEGTATVYTDALQFRKENGRLVAMDPARGSLLSQSTGFGRGGLDISVEEGYNRVEGLPIALDARFEAGTANPTILSAGIIYRTGNGFQFHPDEIGHDVHVRQYLGGFRSLLLGLGWYRFIDPIERRGLTDTENSLSTFVLHRDFRDHYVRGGWRVFFSYMSRTRPFEVGIEYRDEHHSSISYRNPWSLLDNDEPWRAQPQVAHGPIRTVGGWLRWDTRNDRRDPSAGWLLEAGVEQGVEGDLKISLEQDPPAAAPATETYAVNAEYTTVRLEARRYLRLGPRSRIALRAMAAGSPDDGALPPQRQHVLGGVGSLPGYDHFTFDCGARDRPLDGDLTPFYGCDRTVLFQAELRFAFLGSSSMSVGRRLGVDFEVATTPELILFADAGRAWVEPESTDLGPLDGFRDPGPADFRYDVGVGLRFGRIGFYLAHPLSPGGDGVNFFVRLGPRI